MQAGYKVPAMFLWIMVRYLAENATFVLSALKPKAEGCIEGPKHFDTAVRSRSAPTQRKRELGISERAYLTLGPPKGIGGGARRTPRGNCA